MCGSSSPISAVANYTSVNPLTDPAPQRVSVTRQATSAEDRSNFSTLRARLDARRPAPIQLPPLSPLPNSLSRAAIAAPAPSPWSPMRLGLAVTGVAIGLVGISGNVTALCLHLGAAYVLIPAAVAAAVAAAVFIGAAIFWSAGGPQAVISSPRTEPLVYTDALQAVASSSRTEPLLLCECVCQFKGPDGVTLIRDMSEKDIHKWHVQAAKLACSSSPQDQLLAVSVLESIEDRLSPSLR